MRPFNGSPSNDLEFEISPCDLFQDVGSIIIEGRLPELSNTGKKCGNHSWPVTNKVKKKCCYSGAEIDLCNLVSTTRSKISHLFFEHKNVKLELHCTVSDFNKEFFKDETFRIKINKLTTATTVMLEQWEITVGEKRPLTDYVNISMMLQAIRSYLHFSQLSSWWNTTHGVFPAYVFYRISDKLSDDTFLLSPQMQLFPCTLISAKETVEIRLKSLPRLDKNKIIELLKHKFHVYDGGGKKNASLMNQINQETIINQHLYQKTKKNYLTDSNKLPCQEQHSCGTKRKDYEIDSYFSQHFRANNCQATNYVGEKIIKYNEEVVKTNKDLNILNPFSKANEKIDKYLSNVSGTCLKAEVVGSSPTEHSKNIDSKTLLSSYVKQDSVESKSGLSDLLQEFSIDTSENSNSIEKNCKYCLENNQKLSCMCNAFDDDKITPPRQVQNSNYLKTPAIRMRSKSTSPNFRQRQQEKLYGKPVLLSSKPIAARRLALVSGTVPIFHPKTGLPISSSPAPVKKSTEFCDNQSLSRSGSREDLQAASCYLLSKSAPASTGLLGNFEESVLQCRMPINGMLDGFRANLGASGTFCPKHVTFPVKVQHFNMSDSSTPSPYLGHIYFSEKKLKHKRYRVPDQGTIQLTIFNPNKTVVKVFIVLYNLKDMPPLTKTFLRQKVVTVRKDPVTLDDIQTLHYLVHLSFITSKTSHIYLHTEIRVIFPQQAPDGQLITITDGPTEPKYTSINDYYKSVVVVGGTDISSIIWDIGDNHALHV